VRVGVLQRVEAILHRDLPTDVLGRARHRDVRPHPWREDPPGAHSARAAPGEAPLRVSLGLLLVGNGEDTIVTTTLDQVRRDDRGGAADAPGSVDSHHRLAVGAERIGHRELGHHHALERVGSLAENHRVDVSPVELGVVERPLRGFADETGQRDVVALLLVLRLTDPHHGAGLRAHTELLSRLRGRQPGSVAAPGRRSRARPRGASRARRPAGPPRRSERGRRPSSGWPRARRPTG
jgi:hypothetical protein